MTFAIFIIGFIILFFAALNGLPDAVPLTPEFSAGLASIVAQMKAWNFLFPISEIFVMVGIITAYHLFMWGFKAVKWVIHVVRGSGTQ